MEIIKLISDLQKNPFDPIIFRKLANYYLKQGMINEHKSFLELIEKKFNVSNNTNFDKKQ